VAWDGVVVLDVKDAKGVKQKGDFGLIWSNLVEFGRIGGEQGRGDACGFWPDLV
jgi:hypothetical protein